MLLSVLVSLRLCSASVGRPSFPPTVVCTGAPFPPAGPLARFPAFIGTMERSDSSLSVPQPRVSRRGVLLRDGLFAPEGGAVEAAPLAWSGSPLDRRGGFSKERWGGLPGSWTTLVYVPRSPTPVGPRHPTTRCSDDVFQSYHTVDSHNCAFRGSVTRPAHFLCTLRLASRLTRRHTRFRMVVNLVRSGLSPAGLQ